MKNVADRVSLGWNFNKNPFSSCTCILMFVCVYARANYIWNGKNNLISCSVTFQISFQNSKRQTSQYFYHNILDDLSERWTSKCSYGCKTAKAVDCISPTSVSHVNRSLILTVAFSFNSSVHVQKLQP